MNHGGGGHDSRGGRGEFGYPVVEYGDPNINQPIEVNISASPNAMYRKYVAAMKAKGVTPMSFRDWMAWAQARGLIYSADGAASTPAASPAATTTAASTASAAEVDIQQAATDFQADIAAASQIMWTAHLIGLAAGLGIAAIRKSGLFGFIGWAIIGGATGSIIGLAIKNKNGSASGEAANGDTNTPTIEVPSYAGAYAEWVAAGSKGNPPNAQMVY